MKIQPISHVTGIRIELSLDEAMIIAKNQSGHRLVEEIRAVLRGSGVDPDTGERVPSALGLQAAIVKALPPAKEEPSYDCPQCDKKLKTKQGVSLHIARMHKPSKDDEEEWDPQ